MNYQCNKKVADAIERRPENFDLTQFSLARDSRFKYTGGKYRSWALLTHADRFGLPRTRFYKIACPLTCELTPPGTLAGVLVKKKVYRPCSLHFWASLSRSSISPRGMPHSASIYSWRWYFSCVGLIDQSVSDAKNGRRGTYQASKAGASPETAEK